MSICRFIVGLLFFYVVSAFQWDSYLYMLEKQTANRIQHNKILNLMDGCDTSQDLIPRNQLRVGKSVRLPTSLPCSYFASRDAHVLKRWRQRWLVMGNSFWIDKKEQVCLCVDGSSHGGRHLTMYLFTQNGTCVLKEIFRFAKPSDSLALSQIHRLIISILEEKSTPALSYKVHDGLTMCTCCVEENK